MESSSLLGSSAESNGSSGFSSIHDGSSSSGTVPLRWTRNSSNGGEEGAAEGRTEDEGSGVTDVAASGSESQHQGLEYRVMHQLTPFVRALLEHSGDVLPEDAAAELCGLLPVGHGAEVARHIAELRRRHDRQKQASHSSGSKASTTGQHEMAELSRRSSEPRSVSHDSSAVLEEAIPNRNTEDRIGENESTSAGCHDPEIFIDPLSR